MLLDDEVRLHQYERTLVVLKRLQEAQPDDGQLQYFEGEVYRLRDDKDDRKLAQDCHGRAIDGIDCPPEAWRSLGLVKMKDSQSTLARRTFDTYLRLLPKAEDQIGRASCRDRVCASMEI